MGHETSAGTGPSANSEHRRKRLLRTVHGDGRGTRSPTTEAVARTNARRGAHHAMRVSQAYSCRQLIPDIEELAVHKNPENLLGRRVYKVRWAR
jgi:hypothetical protein